MKKITTVISLMFTLSVCQASPCYAMLEEGQENDSRLYITLLKSHGKNSRQLEDKSISTSEKGVGSHNLTYLCQMNGDGMFRERCYEAKTSIAQERDIIKMQEKTLLETQKQRIEQEVARQKERDFSMSM